MFYLITFGEFDGNDCTVYDAVIESNSDFHALDALAESVEKRLSDNGQPFESDGSEFGYNFLCPDDCESIDDDSGEPCGLHSGGLLLRSIESYATWEAAEKGCAFYHSRWEV